jgi:hypothetical protein
MIKCEMEIINFINNNRNMPPKKKGTKKGAAKGTLSFLFK